MATTKPNIYDEVVRVTHTYLGPAAERFISRQVHNHIQKSPEELTARDLTKLIDWIRVAVSLLTDDSAMIEQYTTELYRVAGSKRERRPRRG